MIDHNTLPLTPDREVAPHPSPLTPHSETTPLELLNLYLSNGQSKGDTANELYQKFNRELTWEALLNEGYQEDLAPMLYHIITKTSLLTPNSSPGVSVSSLLAPHPSPLTPDRHYVSDEITNRLKALYNQSLVKNMIQFKELNAILNVFEKEGIDVIQLKGAWIAKNYYPDPALRPMADLDLLVRKEDMQRAKECLVGLGYELAEGPDEEAWEKRHFHFPYVKYNPVSPVLVELHQDIKAKSDFISSNILEFWDKATPISADYKHILAIPKEYLLLHLFWHTYLNLSGNLYIRMLWVFDIVSIIKKHVNDIDWHFLEDKGHEWRIQKQILFCSFFIKQVFNVNIDKQIIRKPGPPSYSTKIFNTVILTNENDLRAMKDVKYASILILNLITLNTVYERVKFFFTYQSGNPVNKKDRIKRKYSRSFKQTLYFYYLYHGISLFLIVLKGLLKMSRGIHDQPKNKGVKRV